MYWRRHVLVIALLVLGAPLLIKGVNINGDRVISLQIVGKVEINQMRRKLLN